MDFLQKLGDGVGLFGLAVGDEFGSTQLPALQKFRDGSCRGGAIAGPIKGFDPPDHFEGAHFRGFDPWAFVDLNEVIRGDEGLVAQRFEVVQIHRSQNSSRLLFLEPIK